MKRTGKNLLWVQLADDHPGCRVVWGPFGDDTSAQRFADFATEEIDPATVVPSDPAGGPPRGTHVIDPVHELLAWRDMWMGAEAIAGPRSQTVPVGATTADGEPVL